MSDPVILVLAAFVLAYASLLLYLKLSFQGVRRTRIWRILAELWGAFILITALLTLVRYLLGPTPASVSILREFAIRFAQFLALPFGQQALIVLMTLATIGLFVHAVWSMNVTQRRLNRMHIDHNGDTHDSITETRPDLD